MKLYPCLMTRETIDGCDLGKLLVKLGYARAYDGKTKRPDWTEPITEAITDPNSI